jgi:outer membrane receptor protein involved in Fe transport
VELSGEESPSAPRITFSYQATAASLYYATVSTGYRLGGINPPIQPWCSVKFAPAYGPDSVINYELGGKATVLGGRATLDASVFHMQWRHMQTDLNEPDPDCFTYIVNAGSAASDGFDFSAEARPADEVRLGLAAAYVHARYTQTILDNGQIRARAGDTLGSIPVVPSPWNLTGYVEYSIPVTQGCKGSLVAEDIFHSRNNGPFYSRDPESPSYDPGKIPDPSTNLLNLRAGLSWGTLQWRLFLDNALDSQPTVLRRNAYTGSTFFVATTFRPRTLGTSVVWQH